MTSELARAALTAALVFCLPAVAQAGIFTGGSLNIATVTLATADLATKTLFRLDPESFLLDNGTGDLSGLSATVATGRSLKLKHGTSFDFTDPGIGSFVADPGAVLVLSSSPGVKTFVVSGQFTAGSDFTNAGSVFIANETFTLTQAQTSDGKAPISISGVFQSGVAGISAAAPEPASIVLLGSGLIALAVNASRRRRGSKLG